MISVMVLVCSWERIVRLRTFPFWNGYCYYLSRRDVYKNKVLFLSSLSLLLPQDVKHLIHIHADHCASDISLSEFKRFCHEVWSNEKHNFVTVDLTSASMDGKYRRNLKRFYFPADTI